MSGSGISWAICKSAPRSRQITMPAPYRSDFYRPYALPAAQPTASKQWNIGCKLSKNNKCQIEEKWFTSQLYVQRGIPVCSSQAGRISFFPTRSRGRSTVQTPFAASRFQELSTRRHTKQPSARFHYTTCDHSEPFPHLSVTFSSLKLLVGQRKFVQKHNILAFNVPIAPLVARFLINFSFLLS